jgi:hypothetical protein
LIDQFLRHQRPRSGNVAWRELVASLPAGLDPVLDTEGTLEQYRQLDAHVLLIYGSETDPMFVDCAEALHSTDLRQAGDRCGAASVLWAMNNLTAEARILRSSHGAIPRSRACEGSGPDRRARVDQWLPPNPSWGPGMTPTFSGLTRFRHPRPPDTGR